MMICHFTKEDFFTELYNKIFSDSENETALFMFNVGITEKPELSSFSDDGGIFERLFSEHLSDQNVLALKEFSEEGFLRMHLNLRSKNSGYLPIPETEKCSTELL